MANATRRARAKPASDLESDLETLKQDITRIADQLTDMAARQGRDAANAVRGVAENVTETVEDSVHERPMTTIALAAGLGFLIGAIWRR